MRKLLLTLLAAAVCFASQADTLKTIQAGATDQTVTLRIIDSTDGTPETGVAFNTSGIDLEYWRHGANAATDITEATQTVNGAHADGGFVHIGHGVYRFDLPDAAVAAGATAVDVYGTVTGMIVIGGTVQLVAYNPQDSVRLGMTALPNAAAEAAGGLYTRGTGAGQINQPANGRIAVDATHLGGTAQTGRDIGASVLLSNGTGTGQVSLSSGTVTVGTNNDKTGYALSTAAANCLPAFGCEVQGTLNGTHSGTTADLGANAPAATAEVVGKTLVVDDKISRVITAYNSSTGVVTFAPATGLTLSNGDQWYLWTTPPSPLPAADLLDSMLLSCTVDTANFAGSTTTVACDLTDRDGAAVTQATGDLTGLEFIVTSGADIREKRFINSTSWDGANSELRLTLSRALPSTQADNVTAIIR